MDVSKVTRFEIIDHRKRTDTPGREVIFWDDKYTLELSLQDDSRTLKVFVMDRN